MIFSRTTLRLFLATAAALAISGICVHVGRSAPTTLPIESTTQSTTQSVVTDDTPLPQDPADVRGEFPNGLHYLIRKNTTPPGKVYLNLAVRTGSLNETDQQNGLAHFLEHMAFKGSTHYAPTKLIPMLQHLGMRFGADTNAHTNAYETVFKLSMPDNKPETTTLALTIFSDYANGLSLFPIQIESERRVILEEMRSRMSAARREQKEEYTQLFPGSQLAVHDVLGDPEILKTAQQPLFTAYWNQWYRPEKMTLIVVGDVDPDAIIAQAKPLLGTFTARAPAVPAKSAGLEPFEADRALIISDPEQVTGDVEILALHPVRPATKTAGQYRRRMMENFAQTIVNRRMSGYINTGKAPFQTARVSSGDMYQDGFLAAGRAQGEPGSWRISLEMLIWEIKHAIDDGFTQREWDDSKKSMLAGAAEAITTESTRDSLDLVTSFTTAVDTDQPLMSSTQTYELLKTMLDGITTDDLKQTFADDFRNGSYAYVIKMPAPKEDETLPTESEVLKAAKAGWKISVHSQSRSTTSPTTQLARPVPTLPPDPAPGVVATRELDHDLGVTTAVFENGVVLHHKFSDYKKDQVMVQIIMPGGMLQETDDTYGISTVAGLLPNRPATSHLSSAQIRGLFADRNIAVNGGVGFDALTLNITAARADVQLGLQVERAVLTDGRLEKPTVDGWRLSALQTLRRNPLLAEPQLRDALQNTIYGGDPRFASATEEVVQGQSLRAAQAWFKRIADRAAMEVTIVGDISADDAVTLVGKYLGSLPKRTGTFSDLDPLRHLKRDPGPYVRTVHYTTAEPKALVMAGYVGCDDLDPDRRPLSLAALILTDRMVQHLRFEQQLVYSISCTSTTGHALPGTGMISAAAPTDPKNADSLAQQIVGLMKDFAANGPTEDELATAKKQMANQFNTQLVDPRFWIAQLCELQYHQRSLEDLKKLPGIYDTFTAAQVRDVMRKYATDDRLIRIEVLPDPPAAVDGGAATQPAGGAEHPG